jgi:GGDEF domain-containing protein
MTYSELTGTKVLKSFSQLMSQVLEGMPLVFRYKGKLIEVNLKQEETQGQKLARLIKSNQQKMDKPQKAVDNKDIYKLMKKYE